LIVFEVIEIEQQAARRPVTELAEELGSVLQESPPVGHIGQRIDKSRPLVIRTSGVPWPWTGT
jgi:hypothetical protein